MRQACRAVFNGTVELDSEDTNMVTIRPKGHERRIITNNGSSIVL